MQVEPPADPKSFVHRSGRTARAGKAGDVVTLVLPEQRRETRRLLNQAGIKTKMIEVTHDSPEVLELVGDRAERVMVGASTSRSPWATRARARTGRQDAAGDESGRGGKRKHNRNRNRDEQNVAETEFQHENAGGEFVAEGEPQRKHGDKASKKAVKKNRNRAERRAGMSNPEAERRDYLFEHGDDRREERRKATVATDTARTGTTSVRTMAATSTARTVAMIGTARATSSISATGPDTVATMISAAAGTMRAVISNGPIPAISSVRASLAAMNAATRITASPMTSAPMTAAGSPCATPVRAKAASASIARTRTASYATSVQKVPSVTNAA